MNESFVFYASFHEALADLDDSQYGRIMRMINEYAINDVEPKFTPEQKTEKMVFLLIRPNIDSNRKRKKSKVGRPAKQTDSGENSDSSDKVSDRNGSDSVKKNSLSEPQKEMAVQIHKVFKDANLPATQYVSFLTGEFYRGLQYIHTNLKDYSLTSNDVIQACRNYASVANDQDCWLQTKMPFDKFVKHKCFTDFLPSSFVRENWKKWESAKAKESETKKEPPKAAEKTQWHDDKDCPYCKAKGMRFYESIQEYKCEHCGKQLPLVFYNPKEQFGYGGDIAYMQKILKEKEQWAKEEEEALRRA